MSLEFVRGDLLAADVEAVVNAVNTVGVMGKGIALKFKRRFPENYETYAKACKAGDVRTGQLFVTDSQELSGPRWIINLPTKEHWRNPSRIEWLDEGLAELRRFIQERGVVSIAIPALGCGNGGLRWDDVRELIESRLGNLDATRVLVFPPLV